MFGIGNLIAGVFERRSVDVRVSTGSQPSSWRTQLGAHRAAALTVERAGRKPKLSDAERLNVQLTKRKAELERKLHVANVLIAVQNKAHEVSGLALCESDEET